jgi:hypothetical protein
MSFPGFQHSLLASALALTFLPARAEVTLTTRTGFIRVQAGHVLGFQAVHSDGQPHEWDWTVDELSNIGHFTSSQGRRRIAWVAPDTLWERSLHIRATVRGRAGIPGDTGVLRILVAPQPIPARDTDPASIRKRLLAAKALPGPGMVGPFETLAPRILPCGPGIFPGDPESLWEGPITYLAKVGKGLVGFPCDASRQGLLLPLGEQPRPFRLHGRLLHTGPDLDAETFPPLVCGGLAACKGSPLPLVGMFTFPETGTVHLLRMDHDGRVEPMGELHRSATPGPSDKLEGPLDAVIFGNISALTGDGEGGVILADDWGTLRRITAENQVRHLAGRPLAPSRDAGAEDGSRLEATLGPGVLSLALDPATGIIYVGERNRLRCVTPEGDLRTLLGGGHREGRGGNLLPDPCPALGSPSDMLQGMVFQDGRLFILMHRSLLAFDPRGRSLAALALTSPDPGAPRYGPLAPFTPYLAPARCAHLAGSIHGVAGGDQELFLVQSKDPAHGVIEDCFLDRISLPRGAFDSRPAGSTIGVPP